MLQTRRVLSAAPKAKSEADRIAELEALVKSLQASKPKPKPFLKVSQKGAVSLYGLGRWPITLYAAQWEAVLSMSEAIQEFISDNEGDLSRKE